ncbi:MAG: hypothetical protein J7M14_00095 [Planctomycetes bacterium]|nr:hypothetical protein [Planctomycetota bacterium]
MHWIMVGIMVYAVTLLQTSLAGIMTVSLPWVGPVRPDLLAVPAVYMALYAHRRADAMLAGWLMGMAIDLTSGAGAGFSTAVGPMSLGYALAAGAIHTVRNVLFRKNVITQCVVTVVFCVMAHGLWLAMQWIIAFRRIADWPTCFAMLLQALGVALYTAAVMPLGRVVLDRCRRRLISSPSGRLGRGQRR